MTDSSAGRPGYRFGGGLLALGSAVFVTGCVMYAILKPELGLPAAESSYSGALQEMVRERTLATRAGRVTFLGDLLVAAAALSLLSRRKLAGGDLERVAWCLVFVSFIPAFVFDSLFGTALPQLASREPPMFFAFKSWYDLQFAMGNVPFGLGGIAVFLADSRSARPALPKAIDYLAASLCGLALVGGAGYMLGLFVGWQLNGPMLIASAVCMGALGVQIARKEG
jgi:hypothetical protein